MSDEKEVFGVEKAIRNFPINGEIQYKPNIFTELGIYRNNKFGIRPSIYKSIKVVGGDSDYKIKNIAKEDWLYKKPTATIDQGVSNCRGKSLLESWVTTFVPD